jgi:uncharacterized membrane protein YsdA (DUF1294 family)
MRTQPRWWRVPLYRYLLISFGAAILGALALLATSVMGILPAWLLSINLVTFLTYCYDKAVSQSAKAWMRVPENVLLALAIAGGTPGALIGMTLTRHKTIKAEFRIRFWVIAGVQAALLAALLLVRV